jgi:hypothetical protein
MGDNIKLILNTIKGLGLDSSGSGQGQVTGCCERGNGKLRFIKRDEYCCQLRNC